MTTLKKLNPSEYHCPKDKSHKLRISADRRYSDLWCDCCKNGWSVQSLEKEIKNKCVELLVSGGDKYDFSAVYMKVDQAIKEKFLKLKEEVSKLNSNYSLHIPVKSESLFSNFLVIYRLDFKDDPKSAYKEELERKFEDDHIKILDCKQLSKELDIKNCNYDTIVSLGGEKSKYQPYMIATHAGICFIQSTTDLETPVIPWKMITDF